MNYEKIIYIIVNDKKGVGHLIEMEVEKQNINEFKNIKNIFKHILYFILFIMFLGIVEPTIISKYFESYELMVILLYSPITFLGIRFMYRKYISQIERYNPNGFGIKKIEFKYVIFTIILYLLSMVLELILVSMMDAIPSNQMLINELTQRVPYSIIISAVFLAPIIEELLFRGIFFNYFFNGNSMWSNIAVVFVSGLLFGLMHEMNISLSLLVYSLSGWVFGAVYMITKDIRYSIGIHFINNFLGMLPVIISLLK